MIYEKIFINEADDRVYLETYVPDNIYGRKMDALLVIPGGGYGSVCAEREGEPIAMEFAAKGYAAFVLHYSVGENAVFPRPLIEASLAVKYIKDNAEKYFINPERIFAVGFSAGGHLAASLGILWDMSEIYNATGMPFGYNKIKGVLPIYPVISGIVKGTHMGSFYNLLGTTEPTKELLEKYSLERKVNEKTLPMFIVHTAADQSVSVRNSLVLAQALSEADIPYELHIYPEAPHGMALCNEITSMGRAAMDIPHNAKWVQEADEWMRSIK